MNLSLLSFVCCEFITLVVVSLVVCVAYLSPSPFFLSCAFVVAVPGSGAALGMVPLCGGCCAVAVV